MGVLSQTVQFHPDLLKKYDRPAPRYTSYPTAPMFSQEFDVADLHQAIATGNQQKSPISLYCHIPFCESACYFCGCNTIITRNRRIVPPYLDRVFQNIDQIASLVDSQRQVTQMHWGGGTPNYLNLHQIKKLWSKFRDSFQFTEDAEISIEISPRYVDRNYIFFLRDLGFNRISFGIQDFNQQVQEAINRIQPEEMLFDVMSWIREAGFDSANVDLVYGLPHQTLATFGDTLEKTLGLDPNRIAVFSFAYVPWMKPVQKNIPTEALPSAEEKLDILKLTIEKLTNGGYRFIGMDHFAKPEDELAIAQEQGKLHRNFQGYTTQEEADLLAFGATSISMLDDVYVQNHKTLKEYYQAIDNGEIPIAKGVKLKPEDKIRRDAIKQIMANFTLDKNAFSQRHNLDFDSYFADVNEQLQEFVEDGLVVNSPEKIQVTPAGRLLVRNVAALFDAYLNQDLKPRLSQAV
ncbi:oxygen-independent coproporphyrinogen III oxidase [Geitlerinema sp. PCC 9228]|uniref:oxygen-independent coproporphyrinogen III oxidase n=1 Tax=Geitlerinema sp. PCC 9228 TaxID=111611 RepID=UPI0008F985EC|nr:oxygen-independent coproporphyrinogen III oxidase [Geitlerinema sp. PCC 9228]